MNSSSGTAGIDGWRLAVIRFAGHHARVVLPVPRFQVRVLLAEGAPDVLTEAANGLVRLGVGTASGIADHLRVPEDMVRSALDELGRVRCAEYLEAEGRWRALENDGIAQHIRARLGWMLWNPLEDRPFEAVFLDTPQPFEFNESKHSVDDKIERVEVQQPVLVMELVQSYLRRLNQRLDEITLTGAENDQSSRLAALHPFEPSELRGSGFGHLEWVVSFHLLADRSYDFTIQEARFHSDQTEDGLALASSGSALRLRELYQPVYECLFHHARRLEEEKRISLGLGLRSETTPQFDAARKSFIESAERMGVRISDESNGWLDRRLLEQLCTTAALGGEFGSLEWFDWIRQFGPLLEAGLSQSVGDEAFRLLSQRWKHKKMRLEDDERHSVFGVFERSIRSLKQKYFAIKASEREIQLHRLGFRKKVEWICFASLDCHPDAEPFRRVTQRLFSKCPGLFERDGLELLIELRNLGSHELAAGNSVERAEKLAQLKLKLERQEGGLPQATETLTRRIFSVLSALSPNDSENTSTVGCPPTT
jgi:hypothetical protein